VEVVMIRIANVNDAEQLNILNNEFNGKGETSIDNIRNSLMNNKQEVVIVADEDGILVGFVCVQLKKSFCYDEYMPEITEVYVKPTYRKKGIASEMITFAETYCSNNYPLHKYELLTGYKNLVAQSVYSKLGYIDDNELHLSKRVKNSNS
jgi:GNAT superfamily N-acetyltransferase